MKTKIKNIIVCIFLNLSLTCGTALGMEVKKKAIVVPLQGFISNKAERTVLIKNAIENAYNIAKFRDYCTVGYVLADLAKYLVPGSESKIMKMGKEAETQHLSPSNRTYSVCEQLQKLNYSKRNLYQDYAEQFVGLVTLPQPKQKMIELLHKLKNKYHIIGVDPLLDAVSLEIYMKKMKDEKADISSLFSGFFTSASHEEKTKIKILNKKEIILHTVSSGCKHYIYPFERDEIVNEWSSTSQDLVWQLEKEMNLNIKHISKRFCCDKEFLELQKLLVEQSNLKSSCSCCT